MSFEGQMMSKNKYPIIFSKLNGDFCVYYPSNIFRNTRSFENWEIFSDILVIVRFEILLCLYGPQTFPGLSRNTPLVPTQIETICVTYIFLKTAICKLLNLILTGDLFPVAGATMS